MWIEIFKTGTHTDSAGKTETYTEETLDKIAEVYNERISNAKSEEAPLVKGHPQTDEPAYGWVERLARRGNVLVAKLKDITQDLRDEVKKGLYKKVSMAVYPDLMLRHVGLLGAVPPAVKGLRNVAFDECTEFIEYSAEDFALLNDNNNCDYLQCKKYNEEIVQKINQLEKKIEQLNDESIKIKLENEILKKESRLKEFREFANSLIDNHECPIITPAQSDDLIDLLEIAYRQDAKDELISKSSASEQLSSFSESSYNVEKVKRFFSGLKPQFSQKEFAVKGKSAVLQNDFKATVNIQPDRLQLHKRAQELQDDAPGLSYEEAVTIAQKEVLLSL